MEQADIKKLKIRLESANLESVNLEYFNPKTIELLENIK